MINSNLNKYFVNKISYSIRKNNLLSNKESIKKMKYRSDIDGLRAVAVLPVLIFHAELNMFQGGYLGVDVFFVISGFLITTIIIEEISRNSFSFSNFYERRVRRLLPALVFMTLVTSFVAYQIMIYQDLEDFGNSLLAMSFFSSNIYFWLESGYFERAANLKPLLHTWSLAVEEQYYFFFPFILLMTLKWLKQYLTPIILSMLLLSLGLAVWASENSPDANFYLLPTRAWELMIGSVASIMLIQKQQVFGSLKLANYLKNGALLTLLVCMLVFDESLPHPSLITIIPVAATLLLIIIQAPNSIAHNILTLRPIVFVGLISYSLYLWHQPLLVFNRYISAEPTFASKLSMLLLAFFLAYISCNYVEKPFRHKNITTRKQVYTFCLSSFLVIVAFGLYTSHDGVPERYSKEQQQLLSYLDYQYTVPSDTNRNCFLGEHETYEALTSNCLMNNRILIWGDSHANALARGLRHVSVDFVDEFTGSACPPIINTDFQHRKHCRENNRFITELLQKKQYDMVILHANWVTHKETLSSIRNTLDFLQSLETRTIIIGGVPQYLPDLPSFLLKKQMLLNGKSAETLVVPSIYDEILEQDVVLVNFIKQYPNISFHSALDSFCQEPKLCNVVLPADEQPNMWVPSAWDYGHLTLEGAMHLSNSLKVNVKNRD